MTWEKFWSIIDRVRAQADMQDEASVNQFLYTELIKLPQDELLGFDCVWQSYRNKANHNKKSVKISLNLFALYAVMVCGVVFALPAFAADDPLVVVENLSTFIFSLIRAVGLILLGWGIVQVGLSLQSHDPSQRSQGFLTLAGGLVITFAKEILDLITA